MSDGIKSALRQLLMFAGGFMVAWGWIDEGSLAGLVDSVIAIIGALVTITGAVLTFLAWRKRRKDRAKAMLAPVTPEVIAEVSKVLTPIEMAQARKGTEQ